MRRPRRDRQGENDTCASAASRVECARQRVMPESVNGNLSLRVTRMFADADGESHFEDVSIASSVVSMGAAGTTSLVSPEIPVLSILFRDVLDEGAPSAAWHTYEDRRFVVFTRGRCEIEVSDGEIRVFGPGDLVFGEDTEGKGHLFRAVEGPRSTLFITVPGEWRLPVVGPNDG